MNLFCTSSKPKDNTNMAVDGAATSPKPQESKSSYFPTAATVASVPAKLKSFTGSLMRTRTPKPELIFPPPSWDIRDFQPASTDWTIPPKEPLTPPAEAAASTDAGMTEQAPSPPPESVEPITFAKRLRTMIELLPTPGSLVPDSLSKSASKKEATPNPSSTPPIPPDMDENLIRMLSSGQIMNGDQDKKGQERPSIWSILAGLGRSDGSTKPGVQPVPVEEHDSGGVMMYAPIDPESDSIVELARTETVKSPEPTSPPDSTTPPAVPGEAATEIKVWVPSTTEMSVLTTWWGYRLYLPPPVMGKLGASTVKAAARAAMITSALKWLIDRIPMMLIPVQFRPAVKMLKTLTPIAGYVGVFIAWSWDRICTFDEGNGVVLTASWVLPVALVPMAWDAGVIYGPRLPSEIEEPKEEETKSKKTVKKSRFVW